VRREQYNDVLYAIHNGGSPSGPMPQNIVTGRQAQIVACFVATYSGKDAKTPPSPGGAPTRQEHFGLQAAARAGEVTQRVA